MNKKVKKKILALLVISNLSFYSLFAQDVSEPESAADYLNCPKLSEFMGKGYTDTKANGEVTTLQIFIKNNLKLNDQQFLVTGNYGKLTEKYVMQFQKENGLATTGMVTNLTREKIGKMCDKEIEGEIKKVEVKKVYTKYNDGSYNVSTAYNTTSGIVTLAYVINLGLTHHIFPQ